MRVAFATDVDRGLESPVHDHFGSAPLFIIVESESSQIEAVTNPDRMHVHGQCQPLAALGDKKVEALVVAGIGGGALRKLRSAGIKVFWAQAESVDENLRLFHAGTLLEIQLDQVCGGPGSACDCNA